MMDDFIIDWVRKREKRKEKQDGWQPEPLYEELPLPPSNNPERSNSDESTKVDIWGPEDDNNGMIVIQTGSYHQQASKYYS